MTVVHVPERPTFDTAVTRLFGIDVPLVQGAMAWLSEAELVSAVCIESEQVVLTGCPQMVPSLSPRCCSMLCRNSTNPQKVCYLLHLVI